MLDPKTPRTVHGLAEAPTSRLDPTRRIPVVPVSDGTPKQRLAAIVDSLIQGFQSSATFNPGLSIPMIIALALGWDWFFRHPLYDDFGGLPFNIECVIRRLENDLGIDRPLSELPLVYFELRQILAQIAESRDR
jgi:hypothetical protein